MLRIKVVLEIICNGHLFPAAGRERSNGGEVREVRREVRKEVKRLLEDGSRRGPEDQEDDSLNVHTERKRTKTSWKTSK